MRILQLIDSLEAGGAERMAVSYANALVGYISYSALVTSRKEGALKSQLLDKVGYLFLNKKKTFDFSAVLRLRKFVKQHKIQFVQAHSSSFFLAILLKITYPKIKIIWHDHHGNSEFLEQRKTTVLTICSFFFFGIIAVNYKLKTWADKTLNCQKNIYLPNFVYFEIQKSQETILEGKQGKRIICLANLREQKNHQMLIEIAKITTKEKPDWTFHLVGKDFKDGYSKEIKKKIKDSNLESNIFIYGSKNDIGNVLNQCEIAILTSKSEGLPVALLEYGYHKKAVITTDVGEISSVINNNKNGILVKSTDTKSFSEKLLHLINNSEFRNTIGENLYSDIIKQYSEKSVIKTYLNWLHN